MGINIPTHYAILIGIDDYPGAPLKSCVHDVKGIEQLLQGALKGFIEIYSFTAIQHSQELPILEQDRMLRPTYSNTVSAIGAVISAAKAGDFVYIHYSGHGTNRRHHRTDESSDVALVLLDDERGSMHYLWGEELAARLKVMIDNGLIVTLVLDCCFSGGVSRIDECDVRYIPYDPSIDRRASHDQTAGSLEARSYPASRDISMLPNWLLNPDAYTILTACGPHEQTDGVIFNGQGYGALSYYLLETLKYLGLTRRHQDVHNRLCAKFRGSSIRHTPLLYGNKDRGFFGSVEGNRIIHAVPIVKRSDGVLELQGGSAHGVSQGDQFILSPLHATEDHSRSQQSSVTAKVVRNHGLTSILEICDSPRIHARTGWSATISKQSSLQKIHIRLASNLPDREVWLSTLEDKSLNASVDTDGNPFVFDVVLSSDQKYNILDGIGQELTDLPDMPLEHTSIDYICDVLEHLARFTLIRGLTNEATAIPSLSSVTAHIRIAESDYQPECQIETKHDAMAELLLENKGDDPAYVFPYNVGPCWQVEGMFHGTYIVVKPHRTLRQTLQMQIPDEMMAKGYNSCEDILKLIVTSQPTSFDIFELPRLGNRADTSRPQNTPRGDSDASEAWSMMNFPIRVSL